MTPLVARQSWLSTVVLKSIDDGAMVTGEGIELPNDDGKSWAAHPPKADVPVEAIVGGCIRRFTGGDWHGAKV